MRIDGLSLSALILELNEALSGGRIEKIYQVDKYTLILWVRQNKESHCLSISANPEHPKILITKKVPENPPAPPAFCMLLRKHCEEGRIAQIYQHSLDRIVIIDIDMREERGLIVTKSLIVEIMGKHSNIILKNSGVIVDSIKRVGTNINRFRQIVPGREYVYPPGQERLNILSSSTNEFLEKLRTSHSGTLSKDIINTAAGIGTLTAAELIFRAGLPGQIETDSMDDADFLALSEAVETIKESFCTRNFLPNIIVDASNRLKTISAFTLEHLRPPQYSTKFFSSMNEAADFSSGLNTKVVVSDQHTMLQKLIETEVNRLMRKKEILISDLEDAELADISRKTGDLLMANLYTAKKGSTEIIIEDFYSQDQSNNKLTIKLDPLLSPIENAQFYYNRYNKLKRAQEMLGDQLSKCVNEITYLESILVALNNASSSTDILEIRQELMGGGYIKDNNKRPNKKAAVSEPIKVITSGGSIIIVGKNNRQNDLVTFKKARSHDLWFHTKDIPGSHVILITENNNPADADIITAAKLSAYYSKARQSSNVPVDYTMRRNVKKPAGAKPGFVVYDSQSTIYVTPDTNFIEELLRGNK